MPSSELIAEKLPLSKPNQVHIIPADNGYIVKVGCSAFVVEGGPAILAKLAKRYFSVDEDLPKEMNYDGSDAYLNGREGFPILDGGARLSKSELTGSTLCSAYRVLEHRRGYEDLGVRKSISIYKAQNGEITVDHEAKAVNVRPYRKEEGVDGA